MTKLETYQLKLTAYTEAKQNLFNAEEELLQAQRDAIAANELPLYQTYVTQNPQMNSFVSETLAALQNKAWRAAMNSLIRTAENDAVVS